MKRMSKLAMERQARFNVAWGNYGASLRQEKFDNGLRQREEEIRRARRTDEKETLKAKRDAFVRKAKSDHTLHIGFC